MQNRYYLCKICQDRKKDTSIKIAKDQECPVCLESYFPNEMTTIRCGNGHQTCSTCYDILKTLSNKCPLCRGKLY